MVSSIPLIGGEVQLGLLKSRVDSALQGKGGLVFVKGEAGVEKTRLLTDLGAYCEAQSLSFLQGRCYSPTIPYSPWIEAINELVRRTDPQTLKALCRGPAVEIVALVPTLSTVIGAKERNGPQGMDERTKARLLRKTGQCVGKHCGGRVGRLAFFEGVTQFFMNVSKKKPVVISLEDLQRADKVTLILLRYVTRHIFATDCS